MSSFTKTYLPVFMLAVAMQVAQAEIQLEIPNQLNHTWPGELVHFDLKEPPSGEKSLKVQGLVRPIQIESARRDEKQVARVWSYVTIKKPSSKEKTIRVVPAVLSKDDASAGITIREDGRYFLIDNGTYQFRLRRYDGKLDSPTELGQLPHWIGGMRSGSAGWDGMGRFESTALVHAAYTKILRKGPVFIDAKIRYEFEVTDGPMTEAVPLASGKQSHFFVPGQLPREQIRKLPQHYEVLVRFVMDDPWIDVNERFHFPREKSNWGVSQYWLEWGKRKEGMKVDTVSWVRWFEYDTFGGNVDQKWLPARPRPAQKGRPFALLRPKWNQGGGGAQDFVLTSGGPPPGRVRQKINGKSQWVEKKPGNPGYHANNPAIAIVAAFASKWVGPYANYIPAYVHETQGRRSGAARFPLTNGERSGMHYGQRAYGLCVGPRSRFTSLNDLVRRHTDWTLTAQINKYILDWQRDPAKAGPNLLISQQRLRQLQSDVAGNVKSEEVAMVKAAYAKYAKIKSEVDRINQDESLDKKQRKKLASKAAKPLNDPSLKMARLLVEGEVSPPRMPDSGLWRQRRYQDDFLNPTSRPTRDLTKFAMVDLLAGGKPVGGASQAAFGYIATDPDAWPGWAQGWSPGNPNFHTDKYMAAIYVAGALRDHPHSDEWLQFGYENFMDDQRRTLYGPDGVGVECPGYAGYAMKLQMGIAQAFLNTGYGNPIAENEKNKKTAIWHRKLITPYDARIGRRHEAPIGDTHRWDSGMYATGFARLAGFYQDADPAFASELMGTYELLKNSFTANAGKKKKALSLIDQLQLRHDLPAMPAEKMNWDSQHFLGFGAIMRDGFAERGETFLSFKAGQTRGHYHNDENSFHFYAGGTPIALDYNCSYTPRGDHAALHNSMTFGRDGSVLHNGRKMKVPAMESIGATSHVAAFTRSAKADLVIAERKQNSLTLLPIQPGDHEFGRRYTTRQTDSVVHRRHLLLMKHSAASPFSDYLVVLDQTRTNEPQQLNLHLLAREIVKSDMDQAFHAAGQMDQDMLVKVAAIEAKSEVRSWHYHDAWMTGPMDYAVKPGETNQAWNQRMAGLMAKHKVKSLPLPGWQPTWQDPKSEGATKWLERIRETKGRALMLPPYWRGSWMYGEYQKWLRISSKPGTPILWVLYPYTRGTEKPVIQTSVTGSEFKVLVRLNGKQEQVMFSLGEMTHVRIKQAGEVTSVLEDTLPPLGQVTEKNPLLIRER